ncbi:Pal1-domain-containing protein [Hortaea werneckii]|nr:Pal1-domain-containing protein [Hortaea werneckii]KAI6995683.1 Pal1-domain-containing protein [Hortaea werneckii]KAI7140612.1 Pal1-domain-containing protein [Hortaea werneckii]KAI7167527.1 Pal1-domain-containing protein [Hortaea werneckii]
MALAAGGTAPDRQPSPNRQTIAFSSNNPFRNRGTSPSPQSGAFPIAPPPPQQQQQQQQQQQRGPPPPRPSNMSKNPFLDASEMTSSPRKGSAPPTAGVTEDIFKDLSLLDKPNVGAHPPPRAAPQVRSGTLPPPIHRPSASGERRPAPPRPSRGVDSPPKREHRPRPRGMSESSVMDEKERLHRRDRERSERPPRTESEERRRRERRREREDRHRREAEKTRKVRKAQGLDIIDKLDVTGIYGPGLIHHDGPFDACNPHRNKTSGKSRRPAPMQAFGVDSMNMVLGGSGPLRSKLDLDKIHGTGVEGFTDYASTRKQDTNIVNPYERFEQVHGDATDGLGTSTFLEGAPASRRDQQRRESEDQEAMYAKAGMAGGNNGGGGGLTRKKSLAQRFRGMSNTRKVSGGGNNAGGLSLEPGRSPDARYQNPNTSLLDSPPPAGAGAQKAVSAGGPSRAHFTRDNEINPFDKEYYDSAYEKKGAQIRIAEQQQSQETRPSGGGGSRIRAGSSPRNPPLTRSITADSAQQVSRGRRSDEEGKGPATAAAAGSSGGGSGGGGGGFLSRMKSIRGGRRARPERKE